MKLRSPIAAMLWENWRLTRVEAAVRLGVGIVAASAAMMLFDAGATIAFGILLFMHAFIWLSIARLNGGRFMDGYKPGFPLYLLYTRPVPTAVIVGVAMVYDAITCVALYLVSAVLVGRVFDQPLPLFSVTVWLLAFHVIYAFFQWSTRSRIVQWGAAAIVMPFFFLLYNRVASPLRVEFSLAENAAMVLVCIVAFGLSVAGVARQRRGDVMASMPRAAGSGEYPDWLVTLFRFPCPTSSATRAQVWFELKSSGLPVLAVGLAFAMLIFLLFAISIPFEPVRPFAIFAVMPAAPAVLLFLGSNAFGIRRRQGRTYASAFESTQPYGTAQLAGLKVLVRTACVLAALIVVGMSVWTSSSLLGAWGPWMMDGKADSTLGLLKLRNAVGHDFAWLTGYALAAQAVVTSIAVALMVAWLAAGMALRARYPRRMLVAGSLLLLYCLVLILLALAVANETVSAFLLKAIVMTTGWIAAAAAVFTTLYLLWSGFVDRTLTPRYVCGALVISVVFGAAWVAALQGVGVQLGGMSATAVWMVLSPVLLPLMASVLSPWSLARVRHT